MSGEASGRAWGARDDGAWWGEQLGQPLPHADDAARSAAHHLFSYKMASGFQQQPGGGGGAGGGGGGSPPAGYDYRMQPHWWYSAGADALHAPHALHAQHPQHPQHPQQQDDGSPAHQQQNQNQQNQHSSQNSQQSVGQSQQNQQQALQQQSLQQQIQSAQQQIQSAQQQLQSQQQQQLQSSQQQVQQQLQSQQQQLQSQQLQSQQLQSQQLQLQQQGLQQHLGQQALQAAQPPQQKGRMPRGRADSKPRGRITAYAYFVQTCREEHKKKHPEENVIFADFSKKCSERWRTMVDKEKQRFHEMAERDKKRYDLEMQTYVPPRGEKLGRGRKRKQIKDPNAPKRSLSAFFLFCNEERSKVKALNPEFGVGNIAKELGRRWADCDPETKAKYEALSEKDKARYDREMTAYKKKPKPATTPLPEDDEDDEPEEEEFD